MPVKVNLWSTKEVIRWSNVKCCGREPKDINEYVVSAEDEQCTPDEYVQRYEGTYNVRTKLFYCTRCYIAIGMPLGKA